MVDKRVIAYMLFTIAWVLCVGNLMEIGENMRFRWLVDPFAFVMVIVILRELIGKVN